MTGAIKPPTTRQVVEACRLGFQVFYNERPVMGAVAHRQIELTIRGRIWVHLSDDYTWHYVPAGEVVLTTKRVKQRKESTMTGKSRPGAVSHIGRRPTKKAAARSNNGNLELPGVETDQRRIKEIEDAYDAYEAQSAKSSKAIKKAHEDLERSKETVVKAMHAKGFDADDRPVYTRPPWGTVILQKKGKVEETFKFTPTEAKPKKKKGEVEEEESEDGE